jgi:hypothetical protein
MDISRNHFLIFGILALILGIQLHAVDAFTLHENAERIVAKVGLIPPAPTQGGLFGETGGRRWISPPDWTAWVFVMLGTISIINGISIKRPPK